MRKSLLIVGLLQKDSGKTTISEAVLKYFRDLKIKYTKPVSSFNAWFNYEILEESLKRGMLISGDVLKLSEFVEDFERANPICIMMSPVDPEKVEWSSVGYESYYNQISLLRIVDRHYLIEGNLKLFPNFVNEKIGEFVRKTDVETISFEEFERILERSRKISDRLLEEIRRKNDLTIIESTSNLVSPNLSALNSDCVVLTSPGRVAVIDGKRYRNVVSLIGTDPWNLTTESVVEILKPETTFSIEPWRFNDGLFKKISEILDF